MEMLKGFARRILASELRTLRESVDNLDRLCVKARQEVICLEAIIHNYRKSESTISRLQSEISVLKAQDPLVRCLDTSRIRAARTTINDLNVALEDSKRKHAFYRRIAIVFWSRLRIKTPFDDYVAKTFGTYKDEVRS
jgi:hypothetical protein